MIAAVTAATHASFALVAYEAALRLGAPHPAVVAAALAAASFAAFFERARAMMPDRQRPRWQVHLVEEPFFAHWCAALATAAVVLPAAVLVPLVEVALGRSPALPTSFALGAYAVSLAFAAWGVFVRRRWVEVREIDVVIPNLPEGFEGYRVVHLSDLHIGGHTPRAWAEGWARRSNREAPDLVAVTGDLVTSGTEFHADIASVVGMLEAKDGVLVSLGNHDYFGEGEPLIAKLRAVGARVLRNEGHHVERDGDRVYFAGVDDTWTRRANVRQALHAREPGTIAIVLAHDPALFAEALLHGVALVLAGHTHGGQIALPFLAHRVSLAQLTHRHWLGLYREGEGSMYVHGGLGTTGPPIRLGVAPEIAVLTLRCAP